MHIPRIRLQCKKLNATAVMIKEGKDGAQVSA
jgi:hypothetical protein